MSVNQEPGRPASTSLRSIFEILSTVVAPITVVTALLYYFGWVRTGALFGYFGLDQSVLGFSTKDYLLRSAGVAFRPALILFLLVAFMLGGQALLYSLLPRLVKATSRRGGWFRWLVYCLPLALLALPALTLIGHVAPMVGAVALGLSSTVTGYLLFLRPTHSSKPEGETEEDTSGRFDPPGFRNIALTLSVFGVLLSLFWVTALYAQSSGRTLARYIEDNPSSRAAVLVYSSKRLQITGPGIVVQDLHADPVAAYRFRYSGLRLLVYSDRRWLLLPEGWSHDNGSTMVMLPDDGTVRVELHP